MKTLENYILGRQSTVMPQIMKDLERRVNLWEQGKPESRKTLAEHTHLDLRRNTIRAVDGTLEKKQSKEEEVKTHYD